MFKVVANSPLHMTQMRRVPVPIFLLASLSRYVGCVRHCYNWRDVKLWGVAGKNDTRSATYFKIFRVVDGRLCCVTPRSVEALPAAVCVFADDHDVRVPSNQL